MITTIRHIYTYGDIEIACELDFEPAQRATEIDPPWPAAAYILSAKVGGVDILPLLSDALVTAIEQEAALCWES